MSAQPPVTYLGTRSHQRRGKRSSHVKSYRALISTAIRRRFGGSECWDASSGNPEHERFLNTSSNNGRILSQRPRVKLSNLGNDKSRRKPETKKQGKNPSSVKEMKVKAQDSNITSRKNIDAISTQTIEQDHFSESQIPLSSTHPLPSPGSSASEKSDYQRSIPSPNNEVDHQADLTNGWASGGKIKTENSDSTLGDEGFSEANDLQHPRGKFQNTDNEKDELSDEILSNSLDSCDVFINNFEDLRDELGPLHIVEDEAIETTGRKRQNDFNISDGTDAKKSKREEPNFFPVFFNKISSHRTSFSQEKVSKSPSLSSVIQNHHGKTDFNSQTVKLEECPPKICESGSTEEKKWKAEFKPPFDSSSNSSNEPHQSCQVNDQTEKLRKIQNDDNLFEVPLPPGQYLHSTSSCKWINCSEKFSSSEALFAHLKMMHIVQSETSDDVARYKCFWKGCKVYGKGSSSSLWLEKHVANHSGRKPFACIFDGCNLRFSTQSLLQRHVNHHFKPSIASLHTNGTTSSSNGVNESKISPFHSFQKPSRKFPQVCHIPTRRQFFLPRMYDFFDEKSIVKVENHLANLEDRRLSLFEAGILKNNLSIVNILEQVIIFSSTIKGHRKTKDGRDDVLLEWNPKNLIADEWVPRSVAKKIKSVKVNTLSAAERERTVAFILNESSPKVLKKRLRKSKPPSKPRRPSKYANDLVQILLEGRESTRN